MASQYGSAIIIAVSQTGYQGARSTYIEQSACFIQASWFDINGEPFVPVDVQYRVDDELSGVNIVPWTDITPELENQVTITSAQNAMISLTRAYEVHEVTFQITDGLGLISTAAVKFDLIAVVGL